MGIHKPDVRLVIHYGIPASIEAYIQQAGRGGRDGLPAQCILLYNKADELKTYGIATSGSMHNNNIEGSGAMQRIRVETQIKAMTGYAELTTGCRRAYLLHYFGETLDGAARTDCCDLCDAAATAKESACTAAAMKDGWISRDTLRRVEVSGDARLLLQSVIDCGEWSGITLPIDVLCGSITSTLMAPKLAAYQHKASFGRGKHRSKDWWRALSQQLMSTGSASDGAGSEKLLDTSLAVGGRVTSAAHNYRKGGFAYHKYFVTPAGRRFLASGDALEVVPVADLAKRLVVESRKSREERTTHAVRLQRPQYGGGLSEEGRGEEELEGVLRRTRAALAAAAGINPYNVLSTADLQALVRSRPTCVSALEGLPGWGHWKVC